MSLGVVERPAGPRPRVGVLATHPVQYYGPWYRTLALCVDLEVFFAHRPPPRQQGDGFGVGFEWDVPLLDGYRHRFLRNRASRRDPSTFMGCDTPEIATLVRDGRFDAFVVHGWASRSYWQAIAACRRTGTPVLVRGDSQLETARSRLRRALKYPLYRLFIPRFDAYLVVGERARAYLAHYGADPRRMFFSPHAVDNRFFGERADAARAHRAALRDRWGLPKNAVVFLFSGKLVDKKRPGDFVQAVAAAAGRDRAVWGLVVGDGALRASLEAATGEAGAPIRFAGFLNQTAMPEAYAVSDALVLPSDGGETWGLVVNEAMASGLPAVVSDAVGCGPDLVRAGETGQVFPCADVDALAARLGELAADRAGLAAMGAAARRHVEGYSLERATEAVMAALEVVSGQPRIAGPARSGADR
jgi:glycosyltransferase involved in cell wall biosynthesis